jgi:ribosomal-protein-alanine N-acetyltransferase
MACPVRQTAGQPVALPLPAGGQRAAGVDKRSRWRYGRGRPLPYCRFLAQSHVSGASVIAAGAWSTRSMGAPRIADDAVVLRPWDVADAEWYAETAAHDALIQRFTTESPTLTAAAVRTAIVELLTEPLGAVGFLIADARTGQRLGNIALAHRDGVGEVSYWLAGYARGRGVATRALGLLSDWAFTSLDLHELRLWTHIDNHASIAVAERAGYQRDPKRDQNRTVKGHNWPTVAYVIRRLPP